MTSGWWESSATFKKRTPEKLSFIFLSVLDLVLTLIAINLGFYEMNPLVRFLVNIPLLLLFVKIALPVFFAWLIPGKLLWPSIAILTLIVIWNVKELVFFLV
jgi:hypothetical protein